MTDSFYLPGSRVDAMARAVHEANNWLRRYRMRHIMRVEIMISSDFHAVIMGMPALQKERFNVSNEQDDDFKIIFTRDMQ